MSVNADPRPALGGSRYRRVVVPHILGGVSIVRNSAMAFLPQVFGVVFGIGTSIITARVLGPAGRGVLSVVLLATTVAVLLGDAGMNASINFHVSKRRIGLAQALTIIGYATLLLSVLTLSGAALLWPVLADNVLAGVDAPLFFVGIASVPAALLANMWMRAMMAVDRFSRAVRYQLAVAAGTFVLAAAVFLVRGPDLHAYVLSLTAMQWAVAIWLFATSARQARAGLRLDRSAARSVASYAARAYGGGVVNYALLRVDMFVLNATATSSQVGFYAMATTLIEKVWLVDTAAGQASLPQIAAREREQAALLAAAVSRNVVLLVGVTAALLAPWIVVALYGSEFLPVVAPLRVLAPGAVAFAAGRILLQFHAAHLGRPGLVSLVRSVIAGVGIVSYIAVVPSYGMMGAAVTTTVIYTLSLVVALALFHRATGLPLSESLVPRAEDIRRYVSLARGVVRRVRARLRRSAVPRSAAPDVSTHVLVLCGGRGERWGNHRGVPKHLVPVEGERLLDRTVRQVKTWGPPGTRVFVVARDDAYACEGTELYLAETDESRGDADKFMSSSALWNKDGRTVVLFGDVWHSDSAMQRIMGHAEREWTVFGREAASRTTGKPWGELFAQSFYPHDHERHARALEYIAEGYREGRYEGRAGWREYRVMIGGEPDGPHVVRGNFVDIDDFTDDFDLPDEYEQWCARREDLSGPTAVSVETAPGVSREITVEMTAEAVDVLALECSRGLVRRDPFEERARMVAPHARGGAPGRVRIEARDDRLVVEPTGGREG